MSATVDAEKVSTYFGGTSVCPVLLVPGVSSFGSEISSADQLSQRTFPVKIQYLEDAVEFTRWSVDEDSPYARRSECPFIRL